VKNTEQKHDYSVVLTSDGLKDLKVKNKRLMIDTLGFHLSQMGV
jgi:hypothetical protein